MKQYKYHIYAILLSVLVASCNDWLDVTPRSQIKGEVLYESETGYKQALNGVYIKMGETSLYGRAATMYVPEFLARNWTVPGKSTNLTVYSLANMDFTDSGAESAMSSLFSAYYSAIAQINDILANLKSNSSVTFSYNNDKLIEGEALGLRAFLHLDVLRMWGPTPDEATAGDEAIPYVTEITNEPSRLTSKTYEEVIKAIETDLNNSEEILKDYDPVMYANMDSLNNLKNSSSYVGYGTMPKDEWQTKRRSRFNYYAALATKARFYHWIGETEKAAQYAKEVVDSKKISLCTESTASSSLILYPEHIFGIENIDLLTAIKGDYLNSSALFTQKESYIKNAYESSTNVNDIRYTNNRYWGTETYSNGSSVFTFYKYVGNDKTESDKRLPLLRMAEMYLILTEDLPMAEAKPYFSTFRIARGMAEEIETSSFLSESALASRLEYEYRKEFYGEGQMYYFYKKHNYDAYTWPTKYSLPKTKYAIDKPKGQTNFE